MYKCLSSSALSSCGSSSISTILISWSFSVVVSNLSPYVTKAGQANYRCTCRDGEGSCIRLVSTRISWWRCHPLLAITRGVAASPITDFLIPHFSVTAQGRICSNVDYHLNKTCVLEMDCVWRINSHPNWQWRNQGMGGCIFRFRSTTGNNLKETHMHTPG